MTVACQWALHHRKEEVMLSAKIGKMKQVQLLAVFLVPILALVLGAPVSKSWASSLAEAKIYFEYNSTDQDLGIHIFTDGEAWNDLQVTGPEGTIFEAFNVDQLSEIGSTEFFTESAEPGLAEGCNNQENCTGEEIEFAISAFQEKFPAGKYEFFATSIEGADLKGKWTLSHSLPAPPEITLSGEEDDSLNPEDAIISWSPGDDGATVVRWEVVVEFEKQGTGETYKVTYELPEAARTVTVAKEFFDSLSEFRGEYKAEVLGIAANRNATITEHEFELEDQ
jgi:hypothetical protein